MSDAPPTLDSMKVEALYVVSDLHLGGRASHALFNQHAQLAAMIDAIGAASSKGARIALCFNGDIVDFLIERQNEYVDLGGAKADLDALSRGPARPVFVALTRFTARADALLLLNLGNHDLELVHPAVREQFTALVAADGAAKKRVLWSTVGFEGTVAAQRVRVVHGNASDVWNKIDDDTFLRVAASSANVDPLSGETPNGGTQLVVDVLNKIKDRFPFVDLLKPETGAVPPVLVALPGGAELMKPLLPKFGAAFANTITNRLKKLIGVLSATDPTRDAATGASVHRGPPVRDRELSKDDIRTMVDLALERDRPIEEMLPGDGSTLGLFDYFAARWARQSPVEALRAALREYATDQTFSFTSLDSYDRDIDAREDSAHAVLIAGHTHLARFAPRARGGSYINTGTWIRLIRITDELLSDRVFPKVYAALERQDIASLDEPQGTPPIIFQRNSVAYVGPANRHGAHPSVALFSFVDGPSRWKLEAPPQGL